MNFIKVYLEKHSFGNTEFSLYYDGEFKKLHILDLDKENRMTVTNAVCRQFFESIDRFLMRTYNEGAYCEEYDIYLYGTDGVISEFSIETGEFRHTDPWDGHIYEPFKKVAAQRWNENYIDLLDKKYNK